MAKPKAPTSLASQRKLQKFFRDSANQAINERFKTIEEMLKPKPRYLPKFVWKWLVKKVVDFNIYKNFGGHV